MIFWLVDNGDDKISLLRDAREIKLFLTYFMGWIRSTTMHKGVPLMERNESPSTSGKI